MLIVSQYCVDRVSIEISVKMLMECQFRGIDLHSTVDALKYTWIHLMYLVRFDEENSSSKNFCVTFVGNLSSPTNSTAIYLKIS